MTTYIVEVMVHIPSNDVRVQVSTKASSPLKAMNKVLKSEIKDKIISDYTGATGISVLSARLDKEDEVF